MAAWRAGYDTFFECAVLIHGLQHPQLVRAVLGKTAPLQRTVYASTNTLARDGYHSRGIAGLAFAQH